MKRMLFFIAITSIVFLGGCGFNTDQMDEMLNALAEDKSVKEFVKTVGYKQLEGPVEDSTYGDEGDVSYSYEINGTLVDTFDKVSAKEQFAFMESVIKKAEKFAGPIEYTEGEVYCGSDEINCSIDYIEFQTADHKYKVEYWNASHYLYKDDEIVYDASAIDGKYIDPSLEKEETETVPETNYDISTADGDDWAGYDEGEKYSVVNDSLKAIRESGMLVEFDVDWFIEALDAYYGDGGENLSDERILDIVTMSGVAGEMIQDPK